tara:strand:- start:83 stop:1246 length:1164 start_codon:yes stop_codon:yes gene_type:complete
LSIDSLFFLLSLSFSFSLLKDGDIFLGEHKMRADTGLYFFENVGDSENAQFIQRISSTRNPVFGISLGKFMSPFIFDFDNDGDGDLLVGILNRYLTYYENTGSATNPAFTQIVDADQHPYSSILTRRHSQPTIMPIKYITWTYVIVSQIITESKNEVVSQTSSSGILVSGTLTTALTGSGMISVTITSHLGIIFNTNGDLIIGGTTIDQDHLVRVTSVTTILNELVTGTEDHITYYASSKPITPTFTPRLGGSNPFDDLITQAVAVDPTFSFLSSFPTMGDLDNDGDLDLVVGTAAKNLFYFRNDGSAKVPKFTIQDGSSATSSNLLFPLHGKLDSYTTPVLFDLSQDGKLDLIVGNLWNIVYAKNTGTKASPVFTLITGAESPFCA